MGFKCNEGDGPLGRQTMRKLLFILAVVAAICAMAQGQIGVTYSDKVVWRGFELFGETDGLMPQLNFDAGPVNVTARGLLATDSGYDSLERWDGQISYTQKVEPFEVTAGYGYYYTPNSDLDFQELWATVALPIGPIVPRYTLVRAEGDGPVESAWLHVAGVDLKLTDKARAFGEVTYNEGFSPLGGSVDSDWSHVLAGASVDVPIAERVLFTSAVYYQHTLNEQVNPEKDQVWYSVGLAYTF